MKKTKYFKLKRVNFVYRKRNFIIDELHRIKNRKKNLLRNNH